MKLNKRGLLVVLSGPSGVGKGTVRKALFKLKGQTFSYSVSMTTRSPRNGEIEGVDYYFVTREKFLKKISEGNFLEYANFVDNYYGTPLDIVEKKLDQGLEVIVECDVEGAMQIKKKMDDAVLVFIAPPSKKALYDRLISRGTEDSYQVEKRILKANSEFKLAHKYDYIVINDEVKNAAEKIQAIIIAEHAKTERSIHSYMKLLEAENGK